MSEITDSETQHAIQDLKILGVTVEVMQRLEEKPDTASTDLPFSDQRSIPSSTPGGKPLGIVTAHASTAEKLTNAVRALDAVLNPMHIESALSGATITPKIKGDGYNIEIPRLDSGETLNAWKTRTSGLAETLRTASEGAIKPVSVSKGGRITAKIKPSEITQGLLNSVA